MNSFLFTEFEVDALRRCFGGLVAIANRCSHLWHDTELELLGEVDTILRRPQVSKPIKIKPSHKGELRKELGAKPGKDLSEKRLHAAARSAKKHGDTAEEKRITFAENAARWSKGKKK